MGAQRVTNRRPATYRLYGHSTLAVDSLSRPYLYRSVALILPQSQYAVALIKCHTSMWVSSNNNAAAPKTSSPLGTHARVRVVNLALELATLRAKWSRVPREATSQGLVTIN